MDLRELGKGAQLAFDGPSVLQMLLCILEQRFANPPRITLIKVGAPNRPGIALLKARVTI